MLIQDRRRCRPFATPEMLASLNAAQRAGVASMERQGWKLHFVRRTPPRGPQPVLVGHGNSLVALSADGRIDTTAAITQRD